MNFIEDRTKLLSKGTRLMLIDASEAHQAWAAAFETANDPDVKVEPEVREKFREVYKVGVMRRKVIVAHALEERRTGSVVQPEVSTKPVQSSGIIWRGAAAVTETVQGFVGPVVERVVRAAITINNKTEDRPNRREPTVTLIRPSRT